MSSSNFNAYSAYYDLLYRDKDYAGESAFVLKALAQAAPSIGRILDLGCGTGAHGREFAKAGHEVTGIDLSETMLDCARDTAKSMPELASRLSYQQGDIRSFAAPGHYDAVVSMFDVVSYVNSYADLERTFKGIAGHLKPGGVFGFDCWYGPAVYTQQPGTRVRRLEDDRIAVTRVAEATFDHARNVVHVDYELFVKSKSDGRFEQFAERHSMRCFFDDELDSLLGAQGFRRVGASQLVSGAAPSTGTWSVFFVYQRV